MRSRSLALGRGGFTLMEVVVALSIGALVLLGARAMLSQLADSAEATAGAAAETDREANGERLLRDVVSRVEISDIDHRGVWGDEAGARFSTWCQMPDGWLERCTALLGVVRLDTATVLALELPRGEVHPVRRGFGRARLMYLIDAANGGRWTRNWSSTVTAPLAIGVVADADTLILRIGERG
jgi:prepilin-type N-terminal cleavage/methylation domain-containing protein